MPLHSRIEQASDFVRLGFADILDPNTMFWSLYFRTDAVATTEVQQLLVLVPRYNGFDGAAVAAALEEFKGRVTHWEFGRERSPVLYLCLPYRTNQLEGQRSHVPGEKIPEAEHAQLLLRLREVFVHGLGAEEFTLDERQHNLRIWWG